MALQIKWNDDRVRGATTALLLISRDQLSRGKKNDLIRHTLADYRDDPEGYKANKTNWPDARELGALANPSHVAYCRNLLAAVDALLRKMAESKRHSNSLLELGKYLIASPRPRRT